MEEQILSEEVADNSMTIAEFADFMKSDAQAARGFQKMKEVSPEQIREWCDLTGSFTCGWFW